MAMLKFLPLFILIALTTTLSAQKEANIWYFGHNAGLDFNSGAPVPLTDGVMNTDEGCASIADANGALLFYTDGTNVWNKNHVQMPNGFGLLGHKSSTQSGVIVPKPGALNIYYVFTVDYTAHSGGVAYSEVDMTLDGGQGDVTAVKNVQLVTPACEKITAVLHHNEKDIWVIGHGWNSANYMSWLVTATGVDASPVISTTGSFIGSVNSGDFNAIGYLKASANGDRIAAAHWYGLNKVEVFDFDNTTGQLSNPIVLTDFAGSGCYGVEFAPSEPILYVSERSYEGVLYQYDLSSNNEATINDTRVSVFQINNVSTTRWGGIQLGPDGRMYVSKRDFPYLGIINNPDVLGLGCNFVEEGVYLDGKVSWIGLPSFIQSYFVLANFSFEGLCPANPTQFTLEVADAGLDSLRWNFGDPDSGTDNFSTETDPIHIFSDTGTFEVTLIVFGDGLSDTSSQEITLDIPDVNLGPDLFTCPEELNILDATTLNATYLWSDGSTNATLTAILPGQYFVEIEIDGCPASDTILVSHLPTPDLDLGEDTSICENETHTFDATTPDVDTYVWQNNSVAPTLTPTAEGNYSVTVTGINGCTSIDSATLTIHPLPVFSLGPNTEVCENENYLLDAGLGNTSTYLWQNGSTNQTLNVSQGGIYSVEVTTLGCTSTDEVEISYTDIPILDLGQDPSICENETHTFDATSLDVDTYLWQNNSVAPTLTATAEGNYSVTVTGINGCTSVDSATLTINPFPVFSLGPNTEVCKNENYLLDAGLGNTSTYLWSNGSTYQTLNVSQGGIYTVEVTTLGCTSTDEVEIFYTDIPIVDLGNDTLLCEDDELLLDAYYDDLTTYTWHNNSNLPTFNVTEPGTYTVTLQNICGSTSDEIVVGENVPPIPLFIGNDTVICIGDAYLLDATNTNTTHYLWQTGSDEPTIIVQDPGFYAITWANECGFVTESIEVDDRKCECPVVFPNVFSPDGDGWNEIFNTVSPCDFTKYNLKIFSRWGELLFETNDPTYDAGWKGTFNGKDVGEGVYIYTCEYEHEFDQGRISGDVTILR